jgi:ribosomal protein L17
MFDLERFYPKKLDDVEVKKKYQAELANRFAKDNLGYHRLIIAHGLMSAQN